MTYLLVEGKIFKLLKVEKGVSKMEDLLSQIGNIGFPIVVSMYLLMRLEGKMEQLTVSISKLTDVLEKNKDS